MTTMTRRTIMRKNRRKGAPIQMGFMVLGTCLLVGVKPGLQSLEDLLRPARPPVFDFSDELEDAPGARRLLFDDDAFQDRRLNDDDDGKSCIEKALSSTNVNDTGFPHLPFEDPKENGAAVVFELFVVLYTFLGLAIICDVYFESALEAITEQLKLKDDVAGATFMAAGGSAPELSTSIMGVFVAESDIGIGTIVGSAVFNVLFVIACCAFVAPNLKLSWWPLARDSVYYIISIMVLTFFMIDNRVHIWEAVLLLLMYVGYVTVMYYNEALEAWCISRVELSKKERKPWQKQMINAIESQPFNLCLYVLIIFNTVVVILDMRNKPDESPAGDKTQTEEDVYKALNYCFSAFFLVEMLLKWAAVGFFGYWRQPLNCFDGVLVFLIFVEFSFANASEIAADQMDAEYRRMGINTSSAEVEAISIMGVTRSLRFLRFIRFLKVLRIVRLYRAFAKSYADATTQVMPNDWHMTINGHLVPDKDSRRCSLPALNQVEGPQRASKAGEHHESENEEEDDDDGPANPFEVPETLTGRFFWVVGMPLAVAMWITIPDCRRPAFQRLWAFTFLCSIVWIAVLAYFMVWMVTDFGARIGVPDTIMGLTLLASGTSIPDALSSIAVARRGHGDMAVSSSIGSNIFDILIGLPVPWFLYTLIKGIDKGTFIGPYSCVVIKSDSLIFMILLLFLMVALVITTVHVCSWRLLIKLGYMMMVFYFLFVAISLLLEFGLIFGC